MYVEGGKRAGEKGQKERERERERKKEREREREREREGVCHFLLKDMLTCT